jgi:hypothetical protein
MRQLLLLVVVHLADTVETAAPCHTVAVAVAADIRACYWQYEVVLDVADPVAALQLML